MKIGILTLPLHTNYGGILQAFALQTVLEHMGHKVIVLNSPQHKQLPLWKMPFSYTKRILQKYILGQKDVRVFYEQWYNKTYPIISQHTEKFIESYIHQYRIKNLSKLKKEELDAIIVGSDQIWRTCYYPQIENAFLAFTKDWKHIKRIAYAPSFGTDKWEYSHKQTLACKRLIKNFNAVSVREISAIDLCNKYLDCIPTLTLDPTLLLNAEDYIQLINQTSTNKTSNMLLTYILDENEEKNQITHYIAKEKRLNIVRVNSKVENTFAKLEERIQPPVEQWIKGFYDAEFIVTDSFHACVFSIIFNKPFIVYGNRERGYSRFTSLLSLFDLTNQLVTNIDEIPQKLYTPIDWNKVNQKRSELKKLSMSFLKNSLQQQ